MAQTRRSTRRPVRGAPIVRKNTVRLPGDVAQRVRAGHPWVYREALGPRPIAPEPGTVIDLVDPDGECLCFVVLEAPVKLIGPLGRLINPFLRI